MAQIRQYVGARYTTKVYENSLDPSSAEWESGRSWEPLILVTWNNSSYLSKKEIPSTVGNPADNPQYWVCTGYYNGQISSLQHQIDDMNDGTVPGSLQNQIDDMNDGTVSGSLQNQINKLNTRMGHKYIFVGDSYSAGTYGATGWIDLVTAILGLTHNVNQFDARGYVGYYGGSFGGGTFKTQIEAIYQNFPNDADTITDICVFAGYNERTQSDTDIDNGIDDFCDYAKQHFPNATVMLGFIGRGNDPQYFVTMNNKCMLYINGACRNGARYVTNIEYVNRLYSDYNADTIHPNSYVDLANYIALGILNGSVDVTRLRSYTVTLSDNASGTCYVTIKQINGFATVDIVLSGSTLAAIPYSSGYATGSKIGTIDFDIIHKGVEFPMRLMNRVSGNFGSVNGVLSFTSDTLKLKSADIDTTDWVPIPISSQLGSINQFSTVVGLDTL